MLYVYAYAYIKKCIYIYIHTLYSSTYKQELCKVKTGMTSMGFSLFFSLWKTKR